MALARSLHHDVHPTMHASMQKLEEQNDVSQVGFRRGARFAGTGAGPSRTPRTFLATRETSVQPPHGTNYLSTINSSRARFLFSQLGLVDDFDLGDEKDDGIKENTGASILGPPALPDVDPPPEKLRNRVHAYTRPADTAESHFVGTSRRPRRRHRLVQRSYRAHEPEPWRPH